MFDGNGTRNLYWAAVGVGAGWWTLILLGSFRPIGFLKILGRDNQL